MLIGYARTSTEEQVAGLEAQVRELDALCQEVCSEHISSVADVRPVLEAVILHLSPGDTLVVTKLDRLARSVIGLWHIVQRLEDRGAHLRILNFGGDTIDTKSATGRLMLTMFAGFAQFERETMLERQKPGVEKAKAEGKYVGRPRETKATGLAYKIVQLKREGFSVREIADRLEIGRGAVLRAMGKEAA